MPQSLILKKNKGFYSIPMLEEVGVKALFTTRAFDMGFEAKTRRFPNAGISWVHLVRPSQIHADVIAVVDRSHRGCGSRNRATALAGTDALITNERHLPVAVLTADCLPVFLADPGKKVVAVVHAGWRGAQQKIVTKTIQKMNKVFSVQPRDLVIFFGPAIRSCCYEVSKEFVGYFKDDVAYKNRKLYFDLVGAVVRQLERAGVKSDHIFDSRLCTSCRNEEFFSYRREGRSAGRSMSVAELES